MYTDFLLHHYGGSLCVFSFSRSATNNINLRLTISREMFMQISLILYVRALISSFIPLAYVNGNSFLSRSIPQPAIQKWVKSQYRKWNWNFFSSLHWFRVFLFSLFAVVKEWDRERRKLGQVKRISDKSKTSLWGLIAHCGLFFMWSANEGFETLRNLFWWNWGSWMGRLEWICFKVEGEEVRFEQDWLKFGRFWTRIGNRLKFRTRNEHWNFEEESKMFWTWRMFSNFETCACELG
jgi:hypothetical protein